MVFLVVKKGSEDLFLLQSTTTTLLADLTKTIVSLNNKKAKLNRLISATQDLVLHGKIKPENEWGYSEDELDNYTKNDVIEKQTVVKNGIEIISNPDPTGRRTGDAPNDHYASVINKTLENAKTLLSNDQIKANRCINEQEFDEIEAFNMIKGALTITFPEGLPDWEPSAEILENREHLEGQNLKEVFEPNDTSLWWANKELVQDKTLADFVGKNEKTKIIIKIQKKGQGAPVREAPLSEDAQKQMMAYYYKKQEEQKRLLENEDDDYLNSPWASTKSLKTSFAGVSEGVKWKPI